MARKKLTHKLNIFATIQSWFFKRQVKKNQRTLHLMNEECNIKNYQTVLDIGCGNGALSASLHDLGLTVVAIDNSAHRIKIAKRKTKDLPITFVKADALEPLPFKNKSFDIVMAAYLAHAFEREDRVKLYQEMSRLAKHKVIIQDYTSHRTPWITFSEFVDGGHYYQFSEFPEKELKDVFNDLEEGFKEVTKVEINPYTAWYICTPKAQPKKASSSNN